MSSSRPREKVAAAFRRLFGSTSDKSRAAQVSGQGNNEVESVANGDIVGPVAGHAGAKKSLNQGSPAQSARRLLARHGCRGAVTPAESTLDIQVGGSLSKGLRVGTSKSAAGAEGSTTCTTSNPDHPSSSSSSGSKRRTPSSTKGMANNCKTVRVRRLMKEFRDIQKLTRDGPSSDSSSPFTAELVNGDCLSEWHIRLYRVDPDSDLSRDMRELGVPYILLHLIFPESFPFTPPFMRVVSPRIERGYVMDGGAICMELLTPRGWASAYTVEAIIMQFAASIVKGQGRIARKAKGTKEFNRRSAEDSFRSLVKTHEKYGWVTPPLADG
ncbi:ubiquitin-conjugating enzyme E2Q-like protein CG4502 [Ischnura elegans]|uniref:ubiquitin-conjugating enzyme E2Q-like protein CG4502 n=1 Tax=Ischnura elegans TaxID=197161 RepID=UPI001ED8A089|nr:ubiquitin-conjugating enzyme E2Q-like protein CG4502 [Ischnura elegans]XP_046386104.1 ubiquitin-conjugating enzyme E2Q-like protein CG4502 [Ischnura elegans]